MMHKSSALRFAALLLALGAGACSTSTFSAQVVSCADRKPVPEARLSYKPATPTEGAEKAIDEMPARTGDTGRIVADVDVAKGTTYLMSVEKNGYASKTAPITSGKDEVVCIDPE